MRKLIRFGLLLCVLALVIYLTSYISRLPESNCTTNQVSTLSSDDHVYEVTLFKKDCGMGETTFYSIRIDKIGAWFTRREIEQDPFPAEVFEPVMKWNAHRLEIEIPAKLLSGSIERRFKDVNDDLIVIQSYVLPKI